MRSCDRICSKRPSQKNAPEAAIQGHCRATRQFNSGHRSVLSIINRACPEIESVWFSLLIARAIGFLDEHKASRFIKAASAHIALERPKMQTGGCVSGNLQQLRANPASLGIWQHV